MPSQPRAANWWTSEGDSVRCCLCPNRCRIGEGEVGFCGVRKNTGAQLSSLNYGKICVTTLDSIEKKPLFHYRPGSKLYSVGTVGCNLDCPACQNFMLARGSTDTPFTEVAPADLVFEAQSRGADGIGWTFNEPVVWAEYVIDVSMEGSKKGLYSVMNTNGFIEKKARDDLLPHIDAMKVDVKSFNEAFYRSCGGMLDPVLETCIASKEHGVHLELAYLLIPGLNDAQQELESFSSWVVATLGRDVPVHLFRFSPAYKLKHMRQESLERMQAARHIALSSGLKYVYFGGVVSREEQSTRCSRCGTLLISRDEGVSEKLFVRQAQVSRFCPNFSNVAVNVAEGGKCPDCGEPINIKLS